MEGWLNINKHKGVTSNGILDILKRKFNLRKLNIKIGHAGTLDPLATGVLVIAIGNQYTKQISTVMGAKKTYDFTIQLGIKTDSGDLDGKITNQEDAKILFKNQIITQQHLIDCCIHFTGKIIQKPPIYSAIKINGTRAYDLARDGKVPDIPSREVEIYELKLLNFDAENAQISYQATCSKGTYIRTLAEDIAKFLGTIGVTIQLNRSQVGLFSQNNSVFVANAKEENIQQNIY